MLVEVKVKITKVIDNKTVKKTAVYLKPDCELFVEAEHSIMAYLTEQQRSGLVKEFEIQSLRISPIKEVCTQFAGQLEYIATLVDVFHTDEGVEKTIRYKVLLWANSNTEAISNIETLVRQGYDMRIESIKAVDYEFLMTTEDVEHISSSSNEE